jgi:hypothetical protein
MLRVDSVEFMMVLLGVSRVLKPHGVALFQYHTADLFDAISLKFASSIRMRSRWPDQARFYNGVNNPYYAQSDSADIVNDLEAAGLYCADTTYVRAVNDETWWEVDAVKLA